MALTYTADQWNAIAGANQHVLVAAGAGTGKTRTVIGRILYLLGVEVNGARYDSPISLHEIAAITFTNAAAQDLKSKLRDALREEGRYEESYEVDRARIGTIHAFCAELLREFALRRGGSPSLSVVDEATANSIQADAVRDVMITAVSQDDVDGLADLLAAWSFRKVERFVNSLLDDIDRLDQMNGEAMPPMERTLLRLAERSRSLVDERLARRGAVDFDRVVLYARDMLKRDPVVLESVRRRLHTLIVDEFQDVDPLQKEIAYLLGEPGAEGTKTTHLLLVGDPKQSIYRFRRADVSVWREVASDFDRVPGATVVATNQSFRAGGALLGFIDATVGKLLDEPLGDTMTSVEVAYEPLIGKPGDTPDRDGHVELLLIPARDDGKSYSADKSRILEAEAIAQRAGRLLAEEGLTPDDIAVILPGWWSADVYTRAFETLDIPACQLKASGFYERREILDLIIALRAIRDPTDDTALLGFLRSPFIALRDDTLLEIALKSTRPYWSGLKDIKVAEQEALDDAVRLLDRFSRLRDRIPVDELVEDLLYETGYLAYLELLGTAGEAAVSNVEKFVRLVRASGCTVGDTLAMIAEARERGGDEGEVAIMPRNNAVTVTSVHSAKGLEWKVVFWAGLLSSATRAQGQDLLIGRNSIALKDPAVEKTAQQPAEWRALKEAIEFEDLAEKKRVWYVAATRATEKLVVSGMPVTGKSADRKRTIADYLWPHLEDVSFIDGSRFTYRSAAGHEFTGLVSLASVDVESRTGAVPAERPVLGPQREAELIIRSHGPEEPVSVPPARYRHSATELLAFSRCPQRHWFKYIKGLREPRVVGERDALVDAVKRGLIVHDVLERIEEEHELDLLLDDAIRRRDPDAPPAESAPGVSYRSHLKREITTVLRHPAYRELATLPTARKELRFLDVSRDPERFEGSFDLIAARDDKLTVLDVKTTQCSSREAHGRAALYRPQADVYISAAEVITGREVERFALQFSHCSEQVSAAVTDVERARIDSDVAAALERIVEGDRSLTSFPGECRFCGYRRQGLCPGVDGAPESAGPGAAATNKEQLELW